MNATLRTALAVAGCACAALPALAAPRVINACQTLTEPGSYVVNRNLQSSGDCLVVAADFVTIDLDGFVITGSGTGFGVGSPVLVERRSINVRNGVITGFDTGVYLEYASDVTVERVTASANANNGIVVGNYSSVRASQAVTNGGTGIRVAIGGNVNGNTVARNGLNGISTVEGASVLNNVSRNNGRNGVVMDCPGLFMGNTASNNVMQNFVDISGGCVVDEHNSTL